MSDRNWDSIVEGVDSIAWKIKTFIRKLLTISLGSKFYILPEKTGGCCANWNGSGQFVGNLMSWHCFPFLLNLMAESWWLSKISLEGNLTGLLILNFNSGSPLPNPNILTIPERHLANHSPGWQYFKVLLMCK